MHSVHSLISPRASLDGEQIVTFFNVQAMPGLLASVRAALQRFERAERDTVHHALFLVQDLGIALPDT